ncbi:MAG: EAL domain-containing protein [Rhizobacter sp.]|nr:EAL domain-containing protein [Rhizobacter sp.]
MDAIEPAAARAASEFSAARDMLSFLTGFGAALLLAAIVGALVWWRARRDLQHVARQARGVLDGNYGALDDPANAELGVVVDALNDMLQRWRDALGDRAAELEQLRRKANVDGLTGLFKRGHFLGRLEAALQREDGNEHCGLVLLRVRELDAMNRELGRDATDQVLRAIAQALSAYSECVPGCFPGRLNGADFALCLPVGGMAQETAQALARALQAVLPAMGPQLAVALGAIELQREIGLAQALAAADQALARAESRGAYAVAFGVSESAPLPHHGEDAWRRGIGDALAGGRAKLAQFPLIDAMHALVHLECPMRLQLLPGGAFEVGARWLPLALRARLTTDVDVRAVALALEAIANDGVARCVNLSPASLADASLAPRLRALLFAAPRAARQLSIEVAEEAALERFAPLQQLGRQLRPCGVRLGLEHAGNGLGRIDRLFEIGLDFIKLDVSATRGVASEAQRAVFVRASIELLHRMSLPVYAEGVADADDARELWACGIDGITGPWASAQRPQSVS